MATISKPLISGVSIAYNVENEREIQFLFSEEDASFHQQGSSLIVEFNNGSMLTLHNFFSAQPNIGFSDGAFYSTQSFVQETMDNPIRSAVNYLEPSQNYSTPANENSPNYFNASTGTSSRGAYIVEDRLAVAPAGGRATTPTARYQSPSLDETMETARTRIQFDDVSQDERAFLSQQQNPSPFTSTPESGFTQVMAENIQSRQIGSNFVEVAGEVGGTTQRYASGYYTTPRYPQGGAVNPYMDIPQQRIRVRSYRTQQPEYEEEQIFNGYSEQQEPNFFMNTNAEGMNQSGGIGEYDDGSQEHSIEYTKALGLADSNFSLRGIGSSTLSGEVGYSSNNSGTSSSSSSSSTTPPPPPPTVHIPPPRINVSQNNAMGNWDNASNQDTLLSNVAITTQNGISVASISITMQQGDSLTLSNGTVITMSSSGTVTIEGLTITYSVDANNVLSLTISSPSGVCDTAQLQAFLSNLRYWNSEFGTNPSIDTGNREGSLTLTQTDNQSVQTSLSVGYRDKVSGNFTAESTSHSFYYQGSDASERVDLSQSSGSNLIVGGAGSNTLIGGSGADIIIVGGSANGNNRPTIDNPQATGNSTVSAGAGNDTIIGSAGSNTIDAGDGNDLIFGGPIGVDSSNNPLWNSTVSGNSSSNVLVGGQGNNTIVAGTQGDLIYGSTQEATTQSTSTGGNNLIYSGAGNDTIHTGGGNNTVIISSGTNEVYAGAGQDVISVHGGNNSIQSGDGADSIHIQSGNNTVLAGNGNNTLILSSGTNSITAGSGQDVVSVHGGNNTIQTGDGADSIYVQNGNNTILAENGNNTLILSNGTNSVTAGSGQDIISIHGGNNTIQAGDGADSIYVQSGTNSIHAGSGNNTLHISGGSNSIESGAGNDSIQIQGGNATVNISGGSNSLSLSGNTQVTTGSGDDSIHIENGSHTITSGDGNNTLSVSGGSAQITGGNGTDYINVSGGSGHSIHTGNGNDSISISGGSGSLTTGSGNNSIDISGGSMKVTSTSGNDTFTVSGGNSEIITGSGSDKVLVSGNFTGKIEFGSGKGDVLAINSTNAHLENFTVSEAEALYYNSTGSETYSLSSVQLGQMARAGENFINIKYGSTLLNSQQIILSADVNFNGRVDVTGLDGKAAICAKTTLNGVTVYAVTFGKEGNVVLVPEHFADNLYFGGMSVKDMVGKSQYDVSGHSWTKVESGTASSSELSNAIQGKESFTTNNGRSLNDDDIDTHTDSTLHTVSDSDTTESAETNSSVEDYSKEEQHIESPQESTSDVYESRALTLPTAPVKDIPQTNNPVEQETSTEETTLDFTHVSNLTTTEQETDSTTPTQTLQLHEVLSSQTHTPIEGTTSSDSATLDSVALFTPPTENTQTSTDIVSVSIEKSLSDMLMDAQIQADANTNNLS